jgi:OmpA-OmpF porin, OOP family
MNSPLRGALVFGGVLALSGCVSGNKVRAEIDVIQSDVERARRGGALKCAPVELATAEANLDFAKGEIDQGNSSRAASHVREAETAAKKAISLARAGDCAPKQITVKAPPPIVVKIEEKVPEKVPEKIVEKLPEKTDKDGDGVPDALDRCSDQAEDKDGFQDEDGCPEVDNDSDGVLDTSDKCPTVAGPIQNLGCPDRDSDGVNDDVDKCPEQAEDKDGFQDDDGCPDLDNDGDGVPDTSDKCPLTKGPVEAFGCADLDQDGDGIVDRLDKCPDQPGIKEEAGCPKQYKLVVVKKDKIEIRKQIKFKSGKAAILGEESYEVIAEVAMAMKDNPQIKKIRIEGHTDSVGSDETNLRLSQNRADSVRAALIRQNVDPARLEAVGYGEAKPIASNATKSGKAENRRTEFNIVEQ